MISYFQNRFLVFWLMGCFGMQSACVLRPKAIVPQTITVTSPSFDGSHADSGLVGTTGEEFIISQYARDRYTALVLKYGASPEFVVPLGPNAGIAPAPPDFEQKYGRGRLYLMTAEVMTNFVRMSRWQREGR